MAKTNKKLFIILIPIFLISVLLLILINFESRIIGYANVEEENCNEFSLEDNFDESSIIIVLDSEVSKFNGVSNSISNKLLSLGLGEIEELTSLPKSYLNSDGTIDSEISPELYEYYKINPFNQILQVKLNKLSKNNVLLMVEAVSKIAGIQYAEPNLKVEVGCAEIDDPLYSSQWGLQNIGTNVAEAWQFTTGLKSVRVGVIDSGIAKHDDLNNNVAEGYDFYNENSITDDCEGVHGTHVAGIIGAVSNNGIGVSGVAPNVTLVPLQTASDTTENGYHQYSDVIKAIMYARNLWGTEQQISILNFSVGGFGSATTLLTAIKDFPGLFVWAAGNENNNIDNFSSASKFNLPNLISVGNYTDLGKISNTSNTGKNSVTLFAPGTKILSTGLDNKYIYKSGTSMAAPFVSGVAALMLSVNSELSASELKTIICNTVDKRDNLTNYCITGGRLNAYKAVSYVATGTYKLNVTFDKQGGTGGTDKITVYYGKQMPQSISYPKKFGYEFKYYYDDYGHTYYSNNGKVTLQNYNLSFDTELHAYWVPCTYDLVIEVNGVEGVYGINYGKCKYGDIITIAVKEFDGYVFKNWGDGSNSQYCRIDVKSYVDSFGENVHYKSVVSNSGIVPFSENSSYRVWSTFGVAYYEARSCISGESLITLSDGSQKQVQDLNGNEKLLVWNLFTGKFDEAPILFIDFDEAKSNKVVNLYFSDGTKVKVIHEHAFWDFTFNKYVFLKDDADKFIGHLFNKQVINNCGEFTWTAVKLIDVVITEEFITTWSPVTQYHLCYYVNGMLSMPGATQSFINIFEVDGPMMKYNQEKLALDINTYGLYTYEEFKEILPISKEIFEAFNVQFLKVAIGKNITNIEILQSLFNYYKEKMI